MKRIKPRKKAGTAKEKETLLPVVDCSHMSMNQLKKAMTKKMIMFCHYYIRDWNATQAAIKAGYSHRSAQAISSENLSKPIIDEYIKRIQQDVAKEVGISKIQMLQELKAIATSKVYDLYNGDWITRKDFTELELNHPELLTAVQEVSTKVVQILDEDKTPIQVEYVKLKMYDKLKAIESIFKAMGWNEPDKVNLTLEQPLFPDVR